MNFNSLLCFLRKPEIYKFAIVGICNGILVLILSGFFTSFLNIFYLVSVLIAYEISVISSFFMNDNWTFVKVKKLNSTYTRFVKYNTFALMGLGINLSILFLLTNYLEIHYILSECAAILVSFGFNYIASKKISFKN
jgi:dolichol-phosphate mannosyltransferase